jgi:hypothetical protein
MRRVRAMRLPQTTIRNWMIAVGLIACALGVFRLASRALTYDYHPRESLLKIGQQVVTLSEGGTEVMTFANDGGYAWPPYAFPPVTTVPGGTQCLVAGEPAAEEDDHDERRPVEVKVVDGRRKGDLLYVARNRLKAW